MHTETEAEVVSETPAKETKPLTKMQARQLERRQRKAAMKEELIQAIRDQVGQFSYVCNKCFGRFETPALRAEHKKTCTGKAKKMKK